MPLYLSTIDDRASGAILAGDSNTELFQYLAQIYHEESKNYFPNVRTRFGRDYIELGGAALRRAFNDFRVQPMIERDFLRRFTANRN